MSKSVHERLIGLSGLYAKRSELYGDNYKHFGDAMLGIFPQGVQLATAEDFNRFCIFVQIVSKATRYGQRFANGGHQDSLDDISVYAQMLAEYDDDAKEEKS